jgi:hypothetical protein
MARLNRRVAATATAVVAVLALAACGGGTSAKEKNAYAQEVNAAQQRFASTVSSVSEGTGAGNSIRQQQRTLQRFETAIAGVVKELNAIDAPSEVTKEHERLTTVMTGFGKAIGQANDAMKNPTATRIDTAQRDVTTATSSVNARVSAAIAAINAKLRGK